MRKFLPAIGMVAIALSAPRATAASFTPDPETWRPVAYSDLRLPAGDALSYASMWRDLIERNNAQAAPALSPNASYAVGNRLAEAWHFTINFQNKLVVLTVLHTAASCTREIPSPSPGTKILVCAARIFTFHDDAYDVIDGAGCWLDKLPGREAEDSTATVVYAAYDVRAKAFKTRATVAHQDIPACAETIPLH